MSGRPIASTYSEEVPSYKEALGGEGKVKKWSRANPDIRLRVSRLPFRDQEGGQATHGSRRRLSVAWEALRIASRH